MAARPLKILMVLGSVRDGRMCDRVRKFLSKRLTERGHTVEVADPASIDIPLLRQALHFYPDASAAPESVRKLNDSVEQADAYVILTAEYNRQMPPALTNLLDHCPPKSYAYKTSALVSYSLGPGGGTVAGAQLRTMMVELGAPPIPFLFSVAAVSKAFDEAGNPLDDGMNSRFDKMAVQLEWYGGALKRQRDDFGIP